MITVREIKKIFESPEYQSDLSELSSYAESIQQERPIVYLLSKYLYPRHKIELEKRLPLEQPVEQGKQKRSICDLVVDGRKIEFKFCYDWHIDFYLKKELAKYTPDKRLWEAVKNPKDIHPGWSVTPHIYKDVLEKEADIFVWIICARDLKDVNRADVRRIADNPQQLKYNGDNPGSTEFLASVDLLLNKLQGRRPFSIDKNVEIHTSGHFPSTYYLRLCEFECNH